MKLDIVKNYDIVAKRVVVVDEDGNKLGEFLRLDAINLAEEKGLDLIQVGGPTDLPYCKLMDYGKLLYEKKKKLKTNNSATIKVKEIRLGFNTDSHDLEIRENQARKFISNGDKVKVVVKFGGRESQHINLIKQKCLDFAKRLSDVAQIEEQLSFGQKQVYLTLSEKRDS